MKSKEKKETWWERNKRWISYVAALGLVAVTGGVAYIYINKYYNLRTENLINEFKEEMEKAGAKVLDMPPVPEIKGAAVDSLWIENGCAKAIVAVEPGVDTTKIFDKLGKAAGVNTKTNGFSAVIEWDNKD